MVTHWLRGGFSVAVMGEITEGFDEAGVVVFCEAGVEVTVDAIAPW